MTKQSRPSGLSFTAMCLALSLLPIALRVLLIPVPPHDFWWHMAQGRDIWAQHSVPQFDSFSWTRPGAPYFNQSWLAQFAFYVQWQIGGLTFLIISQTLLVVASYAALLKLAMQRAQHSQIDISRAQQSAALVLLIATLVSFDNWLLRPQTYAIPIFVAFVYALETYRRGQTRALWALPILMILWVNTHGSFVLGLVLCVLTLCGQWIEKPTLQVLADTKNLIFATMTVALAMLCNPRGVGVLFYVRQMLGDPSNRFSAEWLSPSPRNFQEALFFAFALWVFIAFMYARQRPARTDAILIATFFWLAITSGRYIIWFPIIAFVPLVLALSDRATNSQTARLETPISRRINSILTLFFWLMLLPLLPMWKPQLGLPPQIGQLVSEETPIRAVQVLAGLPDTQRPRHLWHNAPTGSYLTWQLTPQKVWIDTRFEFYPPQQWRDYLQLSSGKDVAPLTRKYEIDGWLLDRKVERGLLQVLAADNYWREIHRDARFVIFVRAK